MTRKSSGPSEEQKDKEAGATGNPKRKSFVRIAPSKRSSAKTPKKSTEKEKVVVPDIVDDDDTDDFSDDEEASKDFDAADIIDVDDLSYGEGATQDDDRPLPVKSSAHDAEVVYEDDTESNDSLADYDDSKTTDEKGLAVSSALQRYLAELRKYPLMTIEEERAVAMKAYHENDVAARNKLVTANLRLVVKIAMEYRRAYSQMLDLIQEGNAGLVQAVNRFNPYKGVKLSTYSAWWIRAYILKFLMDNKSLVRMGTTDAQRKLFFRLRAEAEKMYALTQRFDARLLAENIGVKESDVVEMQQRLTKNDVSLDAPVGPEGDTRQVDVLTSEMEDADEKLEREQLLELLRSEVGKVESELNERDAFIFRNRIMADEPITLQDLGDKFGITRERARQLEARVLKKIKDKLLAAGIGK